MVNTVASFTEVGCGTSTLTLMQIVAGANQPLGIYEFGFFFKGTSATQAPVTVQIVRQTTAGTSSGTVTPVLEDEQSGHSIQYTAAETFSAQPTTTNIVRHFFIHPQSGLVLPFDPDKFTVPGGGRLGIRVVTPANNNTCVGYFGVRE